MTITTIEEFDFVDKVYDGDGNPHIVLGFEIEIDAIDTANEFKNSNDDDTECGTITYGMFPAYRSLSEFANELYQERHANYGTWGGLTEYTGFELWCEVFDEEMEKKGWIISGDEGDATVMWLHKPGCKCESMSED